MVCTSFVQEWNELVVFDHGRINNFYITSWLYMRSVGNDSGSWLILPDADGTRQWRWSIDAGWPANLAPLNALIASIDWSLLTISQFNDICIIDDFIADLSYLCTSGTGRYMWRASWLPAWHWHLFISFSLPGGHDSSAVLSSSIFWMPADLEQHPSTNGGVHGVHGMNVDDLSILTGDRWILDAPNACHLKRTSDDDDDLLPAASRRMAVPYYWCNLVQILIHQVSIFVFLHEHLTSTSAAITCWSLNLLLYMLYILSRCRCYLPSTLR